MTFAAKSEADAYDKMLDMADDLFSLLVQSQLIADEQQQEQLAFYLAQHKDELLQALGAKAKTVKKEKNEQSTESAAAESATISSAAAPTAATAEAENTVTMLNQRQHQAA